MSGWEFAAARAAMRGEIISQFHTVGRRPKRPTSPRNPRALIESRYWCFVQYFVESQRPTLEHLVVDVAAVGKRLDEREVADRETHGLDCGLDRPRAPREGHMRPIDAVVG